MTKGTKSASERKGSMVLRILMNREEVSAKKVPSSSTLLRSDDPLMSTARVSFLLGLLSGSAGGFLGGLAVVEVVGSPLLKTVSLGLSLGMDSCGVSLGPLLTKLW